MSSTKTQTIVSKGIYHALPTFPPPPNNTSGYTAVITGANGISGYYMLRVLSQSPERWSKIYCLSRRPPLIPGGLPSNAEHIAVDFLQKPEDIASVLNEKGVKKVDYVFFFSYIQLPPKEEGGGLWSDAEEVSNFLTSFPPISLTRYHCSSLSQHPKIIPKPQNPSMRKPVNLDPHRCAAQTLSSSPISSPPSPSSPSTPYESCCKPAPKTTAATSAPPRSHNANPTRA